MKPGGATLLSTPALSIDAPNLGQLDLADDDAIIDYTGTSPINSMHSLLTSGYAGGAWTGAGINSSIAAGVAANVGNLNKTAIGYAEASALGIGTFDGQAVDGTAVLLRYTLAGDLNLDGAVNTLDFTTLANNFGASGSLWQQGDFNFDGVVNALDFNAIATNFGLFQASPPLASGLGQLVPEPGCFAAAGLLVLLRRRRK